MRHFAVVIAALIASSLQILPSPTGGQIVQSVCKYADGVVLTVPGVACPVSD